MARIRDTLSDAERAELDALLAQLGPSESALVRIIEIFMTHESAQMGMLSEELRGLLRGHERRIAALERGAGDGRHSFADVPFGD